ncbi:MAG: LLM class flavin-dependent oxidoreductase [Deltaproteobacteria bacterium]|nr:LLM class flavin-dependent oxidoreductase [Deltaproteobacteria bacterium]
MNSANIKFGVGLFATENAREGVQLAQRAEALGFERFWLGDSHMIWRELYTMLGAIAATTKRIEIAPGVTHPQVRHLTVTASAMATLAELAPGRAALGIGVGATGPENIGMKPLTSEEMADAMRTLRKLLNGETVEMNGRNVHCVFAGAARIPIYLGTRAPKVMRLAAELGDGIVYTGEVSTLNDTIATLKQCCAEVGRPTSEVKVVYRLPCCIANNSREARNEVKGKIARTAMTHLGRLHRMGKLTDEEDLKAVESLWQHYDTYHHMGPEHAHLVRDEWVERFALAGTPEEVRRQVENLLSFDIGELTIIPFGQSKESVLEMFAEAVIGKL